MIRIIGVGNPLMGDDGVGVALAERLADEVLPGVEVLDGGTGGLTLLGLMEGAERVVLVDAADMGRPPGTVVRVAGNDPVLRDPAASVSAHGAEVVDSLALGRELGMLPPVVLFLVQIALVEAGRGLSPSVAAALDGLAERIRQEVLGLQTGPADDQAAGGASGRPPRRARS